MLYVAIAGDVYDAVVTAVCPDGSLDLSVIAPGTERPVTLSAIRWRENPGIEERRVARPGSGA